MRLFLVKLNRDRMRHPFLHDGNMQFLVGCTLVFLTLASMQQRADWKAPPEADTLKNPVKGSAEATLAGKELYNRMCVICHGNKGKGDGAAGAALNPRPSNLTTTNVQQQTDGAIYWKITEGRAPMASYKSSLTEEQRWQLVNYMRQIAR